MRTILYTMHFRGRMSPAGMDSKLLRTSGSATSCVVSTTIGSTGVESELKASAGDLAFQDSALRVTGCRFRKTAPSYSVTTACMSYDSQPSAKDISRRVWSPEPWPTGVPLVDGGIRLQE